MSLITGIENDYKKAVADMRAAETFVVGKLLPILKSANADATAIEAVSNAINPNLGKIESVAFSILGCVIKALDDVSSASSGGLTVSLSEDIIANVKAVAPAVKAAVGPVAKTPATTYKTS